MHTTNCLVSVIIPVFNGGNFLQTALQSISSQDYQNLEILAVDDGSVDGSEKILELFSHSYSGSMKVLTHPGRQMRGIAASYRLGLEHCRGKYIAFLEHDDVWPANKISEQIKVFDTFPDVGVIFSDVYTCDEAGRVETKPFKTLINRPPSEQPFNAFWRLLWGNCVSTFSNFIVRDDQINILDIIMEPEGFQDWMLLLLLSCRCKFYHCSKTKTFWRQRQESYYAQLSRLPNLRRKRKLALRNAIGMMLLQRQPFCYNRLCTEYFSKTYWYSVISLFSALEGIANFFNSRGR